MYTQQDIIEYAAYSADAFRKLLAQKYPKSLVDEMSSVLSHALADCLPMYAHHKPHHETKPYKSHTYNGESHDDAQLHTEENAYLSKEALQTMKALIEKYACEESAKWYYSYGAWNHEHAPIIYQDLIHSQWPTFTISKDDPLYQDYLHVASSPAISEQGTVKVDQHGVTVQYSSAAGYISPHHVDISSIEVKVDKPAYADGDDQPDIEF